MKLELDDDLAERLGSDEPHNPRWTRCGRAWSCRVMVIPWPEAQP